MTMSKKLKAAVGEYFEKYHVPLHLVLRTDVTLALIRIGTPEARAAAEKLMKRKTPIVVGDLGLKAKKPRPTAPTVSIVRQRTYNRGSWTMPKKTEERFQMIRRGMTRGQIIAKGVPPRDVSRWTRSGNIVWSNP